MNSRMTRIAAVDRRTFLVAGGAGFIGEEPVAALGVVAMRVADRVGEVGLVKLTVGDRRVEPPVVGLASETKYPTRHHDGDPIRGELTYERVHHPLGMLA